MQKTILSLITFLAAIEVFAQARAPKPIRAAVVYHYYGVQKMSGSLQLLASSADPNFFGKTYGSGESATELFNTFAIVYRSTSKLSANMIWRDDHGQPGIRWNQHTVAPPSGPPLPTAFKVSVPEPPLPSAPVPETGGASVVPDTQPPVIEGFAVECGNITNFPTHVLFSAARVSQGWWRDPESTNFVARIFDVTFAVRSNEFLTAWSSNNLTDWMEYPTPLSLHPARINSINGMYFPIAANGHRFFTLRSYDGGTRTTWQ